MVPLIHRTVEPLASLAPASLDSDNHGWKIFGKKNGACTQHLKICFSPPFSNPYSVTISTALINMALRTTGTLEMV